MKDLLEKLAAHRRRIRIARTVETAVRWALYASVLTCVYLTASKIAGLTVPRSIAATVLLAIPLGMAAREWARRFSVRDCAIYLDRTLGLEERLSTAVENAAAMEGALMTDAAGALARAPMPSLGLPREARLLPVAVLLLLALLIIPAPRRSGAVADPALEALIEVEVAKLEGLAPDRVEFREVAQLLRAGAVEEAMKKLEEFRTRLVEALLEGKGPGDAETRKLLGAVETSAAALGAELARAGRTVHAPPPRVADLKLAHRTPKARPVPGEALARAVEENPPPIQSIARILENPDWDKRYDPIIRRYFGSEP